MAPDHSVKRTHTSINFDIKKEICEYMQANPNIKQVNVALHFNTKYSEHNIEKSTIAKIWQDWNKWLAILSNTQTTHTFRQCTVLFLALNKAMQLWTCQVVAVGIPLSDMILQEKGIEFAELLGIEDKIKCGNGWVHKFKKWNGLRKISFSGEANRASVWNYYIQIFVYKSSKIRYSNMKFWDSNIPMWFKYRFECMHEI